MAKSRAFHLCLLTAGVLALALLVLWRGGERAARWELRASDWLAVYGRKTPPNPRIIFLAIDKASVTLDPDLDLPEFFGAELASPEARTIRAMSHPWPWPRSIYARLLDRLCEAGASVVVFDLTFLAPTQDDPEFQQSLERHRDHVVIGSFFENFTRLNVANSDASHMLPASTLIASSGADPRIGFVNFWPDVDGVVRDSLHHAGVLSLSGREGDDTIYSSLAAQAVRQLGRGDLVPTDLASHTLRLTDFPGRGFPPRPIFEVFVPKYWRQNYASGAAFREAVVIVGAEGDWQHDALATALGTMPGPELHCNAVNALLHRGFVHRATLGVCLAEILGAGVLTLAFALLVAAPIWRLLLLASVGAAFGGLALWLYNSADLILQIATPLATLGINGLIGLIYDLVAVRLERRRLRSTFERYVSRNVVGELMADSGSAMHALGGAVRPVTILFSDIRNFTRVCANTNAQVLVQQLNEYFTLMVDCAFRYRGTLDKFMGDAVMVVWGNVYTDGPAEDARQALRCALAMQEELARLNERLATEGRPAIRIGIALNHGEVVAGNIGSPHRMEYTVIGDAVNLCWRLQERTKLHPGGLILGESMAPLLGSEYPLHEIGSIIVGDTLESKYFCLSRDAEAGYDLDARAAKESNFSAADL